MIQAGGRKAIPTMGAVNLVIASVIGSLRGWMHSIVEGKRCNKDLLFFLSEFDDKERNVLAADSLAVRCGSAGDTFEKIAHGWVEILSGWVEILSVAFLWPFCGLSSSVNQILAFTIFGLQIVDDLLGEIAFPIDEGDLSDSLIGKSTMEGVEELPQLFRWVVELGVH
jgi:hypothetical protein